MERLGLVAMVVSTPDPLLTRRETSIGKITVMLSAQTQ